MSEPVEETVVFPHLSGLNWPSFLLAAWHTLHTLGVPEENLRLRPELGHFAVPEISEQDPPGPEYDPLSERLIVQRVDPAQVRPRLSVSIRADVVDDFSPKGEFLGSRKVGRLAHFVPPLLAGLPGAPPPATPRSALEDLTRQMGAAYPELMQTLTPEERGLLEAGADDVLAILFETDVLRRAGLIALAIQRVQEPEARLAYRAAWTRMAGKLLPQEIAGLEEAARPAAQATLEGWGFLLYGASPELAVEDAQWTALTAPEREAQRAMLRGLRGALSYETARERERIVGELMEIMTTEALLATAVIDSLHGIGWIHGRIADQRAAGAGLDEGWFLSVTGGRSSRSVVQGRLEEWAKTGVLGIEPDLLKTAALDEAEQMQLWALVAWRRETADPFVLLQTAVQRLIHPDSLVRLQRYTPVFSRPGTLLAQLGSTAVLGGAARLQYPGVVVELPLSDADPGVDRVRSRLEVLLRLLLPVCCRVEVVWREAEARLDRPSYLRHEFQTGARLSPGI